MKRPISPQTLRRLRAKLLEGAERLPDEKRYIFETCFKRYEELLTRVDVLQAAIEKDGAVITTVDRCYNVNIKINPAVPAYNQAASQADKTAQLILRYILPKEKAAPAEVVAEDDFEAF